MNVFWSLFLVPPPSQNYANELQEQLTLKTFSGNTIGVSSTFLPYLSDSSNLGLTVWKSIRDKWISHFSQ